MSPSRSDPTSPAPADPPHTPPAARRRRVLGVLAILAALAVGLAGAGWWWERRQPPGLMAGTPVPDFALPALRDPGTTIRARDLRGETYLISVFASWCGFCVREHPAVMRLSQLYGVKVLGYNWNDERDAALAWLETHGDAYWKIAVDRDGETARALKIHNTPVHILVDGRGIIRWKHNGVMTDAVFRRELSPLLDAIAREERRP